MESAMSTALRSPYQHDPVARPQRVVVPCGPGNDLVIDGNGQPAYRWYLAGRQHILQCGERVYFARFTVYINGHTPCFEGVKKINNKLQGESGNTGCV